MFITREQFSEYVRNFNFKGLFNYLGWDYTRVALPSVQIKETTYRFTPIVQKSSFLVVECRANSGEIPPYSVRARVDNELRKQVQEHMVIFCNSSNTEQVWLYSYRLNGKDRRTEVVYNVNQDTERLYQRASGLFFNLDEQNNITIFDVTQRMTENFAVNTEKVTKRFYDGFKRQHAQVVDFMDGITAVADREWYASIMLNRLMFCYFIQKRGFLNNDRNYLRTKLNECMAKKGKDRFYSFYRNFLLVLFHQGLASPIHNEELTQMVGNVPYLNGGIFDVHHLEKKYPGIRIDDQAFAKVFDFFDTYEWYLDSRECASGNEISPDVLGYIFEKYINDRSQMGAYYTQEDITEYISRNSILPQILRSVEEKYSTIFSPNREVWNLIKQSGDKYIYDSVKKGVNIALPDYIQVGVDTGTPGLRKRRLRWNEQADAEYALPTETWREVVHRRQRYEQIRDAIDSGRLTSVQDLVTYNLNICAFVQDLVDTIDDSAFIRAFYEVISDVSILDPTCGSGAFLFAALNILEPLYDSCLSRIDDFVRSGATLPKQTQEMFVDILAQKDKHANKRYFITKSIILNNLYGVDIMNEAVETTKLRLFLALVSTATPDYYSDNIGIEPLPDIDFNIKCGNSLVGYVSEDEIDVALHTTLSNILLKEETLAKLRRFASATLEFKSIQLKAEKHRENFKELKRNVLDAQASVNEILNKTLVIDGGSDVELYEKWLADAQPFHWYSEFYRILSTQEGNGGFDVIIGNPPYVEYSTTKQHYTLEGYETISCGNLYAYVLERCKYLVKNNGVIGMIVPLSGHSTERMEPLITHFYEKFNGKYLVNLSGDANPSHLFPGVKFRLAVLFVSDWFSGSYSTKYTRWYSEEREHLFKTVEFNDMGDYSYKHILVKIPSPFYEKIYSKVLAEKTLLWKEQGDSTCYYHNAPVNWIRSHTFTPYFCSERDGEGVSTQLKKLSFSSHHDMVIASAILNSSLFFIWWVSQSDCYHLNNPEIKNFGFTIRNDAVEEKLLEISSRLANDMIAKSRRRVYVYKTSGRVEYDEFYMKKSKAIIDEIDAALAEHYGFTEEELDFVINYEIKYRIGFSADD